VVHTEQHYDDVMSRVFIDQLDIPEPEHALGVGSGTHAIQTARVMLALEPVLAKEEPDLLVVAGDVNSTLAAALTAAKLQIPIAHVESGLRSFDPRRTRSRSSRRRAFAPRGQARRVRRDIAVSPGWRSGTR
jgi:UDP-N-acetylglucosamine 2-epimerase (non-hydrolysing)